MSHAVCSMGFLECLDLFEGFGVWECVINKAQINSLYIDSLFHFLQYCRRISFKSDQLTTLHQSASRRIIFFFIQFYFKSDWNWIPRLLILFWNGFEPFSRKPTFKPPVQNEFMMLDLRSFSKLLLDEFGPSEAILLVPFLSN